jgi:hypothetical protein
MTGITPANERIDKSSSNTISSRNRILTFKVNGVAQWNVYKYQRLNEQKNLKEQKGKN